MSIVAELPPPTPAQPLLKRGQPLLAWLVIVAAVLVAVAYMLHASREKAAADPAYFTELQLQGRTTVGLVRSFGQPAGASYQQTEEAMNRGPYQQRLRFIVLAGELAGPDEALNQLKLLRERYGEQRPPTTEDKKLIETLEQLYRAEKQDDEQPLNEEQRRELAEKLGWFGQLALAPANAPDAAARALVLEQARKAALISITIVLVVFSLTFVGLLVGAVGIALMLLGWLRARLQRGSRDGGIYAETFALWMVLYIGLSYGASWLPAGPGRLLLAGASMLLSLSALAWPVWRGIAWRRVRQDIGWWTRGPALYEVCWGLGCYLASFPLLIVGVLISAGLLFLYKHFAADDPFGIPPRASHPAGEILMQGGWWVRVQMFVLAAGCAPIVEETMFRGVLYRHLREVGAHWSRLASVLFSALIASFIFAVIHPQGALGVPMLMALAGGFTVARELRGSLLGSIAAHGVNNGLVTCVALSLA